MCCLCSAYTPKEKASFYNSTSFPAVPLLHLKVRFYIPSNTTFPTKMAPLRNSPSSLSQHDLLMCMRVCVCVFENAMSVFNYVTLREDTFFLLEHFGPFHSLSDLMVCVSVFVCTHKFMHIYGCNICVRKPVC